ncbi:peptidase T [Parapedobacter pyrenivorans]|uniref:Peptidase T n=1 Tax=Parapedobacter pyrenivorans TaxID=1305674 RepID=A0A917HNF9_9SPHI|nr:peptidase T [Parapedobacter pyrenivorans]GGG84395.1 peptidase T [Parapedobacter pyrenivorans]
MNDSTINTLATSTVSDRFIRYVQVDTQSDPSSQTYPSTEKQKNLGRLLASELLAMGITDAHMDDYGYVYATIPATSDKKVPTICFCSHMDTSPDSSGTDVKPIVHRNYQGDDLVLPDDPSVIIKYDEHPDLSNQLGNDIITASGTTLLGADDKAGIAEIMTAAELLMAHPEIKHGTIKILFTPDEEIGRGVDRVDLAKLGADFAYTVDGETAGSIEDETFSADGVTVTINGISVHPGFAKGKLQSAVKIASEIVSKLPQERLSPESTSGRAGFVHPVSINGGVEQVTLDFIVRDFIDENLQAHEQELEDIVKAAIARYPGCTYQFRVSEQYRNMKQVLDSHPQIMEIGLEAIRRAGMQPLRRSIRGGTDGSRLSFMGLPCPNIFAGGHAFHGRQEWVTIQDMEKAIRTILHITLLWEERS